MLLSNLRVRDRGSSLGILSGKPILSQLSHKTFAPPPPKSSVSNGVKALQETVRLDYFFLSVVAPPQSVEGTADLTFHSPEVGQEVIYLRPLHLFPPEGNIFYLSPDHTEIHTPEATQITSPAEEHYCLETLSVVRGSFSLTAGRGMNINKVCSSPKSLT